MTETNNNPSVEAAIEIVNARSEGIWEPSPAMLGYARAVGAVIVGAELGDPACLSPLPGKEPFRIPRGQAGMLHEHWLNDVMENVAHWLNTGTNLR